MNVTPASVDQMEAITAARRVGRRAALLETATRGHAVKPYTFILVTIIFLIIISGSFGKTSNFSLPFAVIGLNFGLFFWNLRQVGSRLDAIAELLATEESKQSESQEPRPPRLN